jgi:hypothetical protein
MAMAAIATTPTQTTRSKICLIITLLIKGEAAYAEAHLSINGPILRFLRNALRQPAAHLVGGAPGGINSPHCGACRPRATQVLA